MEQWKAEQIEKYETGATRSADTGKLDYEGFLSPAALRLFAEYMHEHRVQADGQLRASDNWQKGMPISRFRRSLIRHAFEFWALARGSALSPTGTKDYRDSLAAIMFNVMGLLHEAAKGHYSDEDQLATSQAGGPILGAVPQTGSILGAVPQADGADAWSVRLMNTLFPVRDRILVGQLETPGQTPGGLHLPSGPTNGLVRGVVIEVGEGPATTFKKPPVQAGDIVHYPASSGVALEVNDRRLKVVPYEHVFLYERPVVEEPVFPAMEVSSGTGSTDKH